MGKITDVFLGTTQQPEPDKLTPQQERFVLAHLRQGCANDSFDLTILGTLRCGTCGQKL